MLKSRFITAGLACLCIGLFSTTAVIEPQPAHAFDFKKFKNKVKRDFKGAGKDLRKNTRNILRDKNVQRLATGIGAAMIVGGALDGKAAPIIIGAALIAAPEIFQTEMRRTYAADWYWAGCVGCYRSRVIVSPGRKVSKRYVRQVETYVTEDVKDIQRALAALGLYKKRIDGDFGPGTRAGVKAYQASLGARETGSLTAGQRHSLFAVAASAGVEREADPSTLYVEGDFENETEEAVTVIEAPEVSANADELAVPPSAGSSAEIVLAPVVAPEPVIREYRLAASQFDGFAANYLMKGALTAVKSAALRPDGLFELEIQDVPGSAQTRTMTASVNDINIDSHSLSDKWVRIDHISGTDQSVLNTVDTFASKEDAIRWIDDGRSLLAMLAKLTETENAPQTTIASATGASDSFNEPATINSLKTDAATEFAMAEPANAEAIVKPAAAQADDGGECRSALYLSFSFPEGDKPINHYNIIPPAKTLIFENGDSTAHITGECVRGVYGYKYVSVSNEGNKWSNVEREGTFEVASNAEQCEVNLNEPDGSARLLCY